MDTKGKGIQKIETFEGWPGLTEFTQLCSKYEPFIARFVHGLPDQRHQILAYLNSSSTLTDISCAEGDGAFSGNPSTREKVDMKVSDFANAWSCEKDGKHHWALTTGLNLYLSQLCLSQGCDTDGSDMELLHCGIPGVLLQSGSSLDRTNLWMNIFPAVSSLHYDANHNLLVVLEGSKHVTLFSPAYTKYLQPEAAHGDCPNHSGLGPLEADSAARTISEQGGDGCATCTVTIHAGDALFIPEGWWHQVRSEKCTMALNYWFCSSAGLLLSGTGATDMSSYLLRAAMHRVVNAQRSADARHAACEESVSKAGSHVYHAAVTVRSFEESTLRLLSHGARGREGEAGVDKCKLSRTSPRLGREEAEEEVEEEEDPWLAFVSCDVAAMRALWVPFGRKHPREWTQVLLSLTPAAADRLLTYWDSIDQKGYAGGGDTPLSQDLAPSDTGELFEDVFRPCGDAVPEVRRHLLAQKDRHSEQYALQVLQRILGMDARALLQK